MKKWILNSRLVLETVYSSLSKFIASRIFLAFSFIWFFLQATFIALSTKFGLPPDEGHHFKFISHIATNHWSPFFNEQFSDFHLGELSRTPFFIYHYLLSFPFRLFDDYEYSYLILRFLNIFIAIGSLFLVVKIANLLSINKLARNISIFMLANTLMFVFLSASISYDNLFIFTSLLAVYFFISLLKKLTSLKLLLLSTVVFFGMLIKISFVPIAFSLAIILLAVHRGKILTLLVDTSREIKKLNIKYIFASVALLIMVSLFTQRYIVNVLSYGKVEPKCTQVLTQQECEQNALYVRTQMIKNSDRPEATRPIYEFAFDWTLLMQQRVYGIFAHKTTPPTQFIFIGSQIFLIIATLAIIRKHNFRDRNISAVLAIVAFYCLVLLYTNHKSYEVSGNFGFASQGRYLFAVLPLMYLLANHHILKLFKDSLVKSVFILGVLLVFATAGLPSYILTTNEGWHPSYTSKLNSNLKTFLTNVNPQ